LEQGESQRLETLADIPWAFSPCANHPFDGWLWFFCCFSRCCLNIVLTAYTCYCIFSTFTSFFLLVFCSLSKKVTVDFTLSTV